MAEVNLSVVVEGETIEISPAGARQSMLLAPYADNPSMARAIPVASPHVSAFATRIAFAFCENATRDPDHSDFTIVDQANRLNVAHIAAWQLALLQPYENNFAQLDAIGVCADYFDIPDLVMLYAHTIARKLNGMSVDDMRGYFGVTDPTSCGLTKEQIKELKDEEEFIRRLDADRALRCAE